MYALKVFWWVKQACLRWAPPSSFPRDSLSCDIYLVWLSNWLQNEQAWHSSSSKASNYSTRVPTTSSCLAAIPLELTKKASRPSSQFFLWLVRGSTTSLFAHLFGNHRPSFKIDNQRLVLVVFDSLFPILQLHRYTKGKVGSENGRFLANILVAILPKLCTYLNHSLAVVHQKNNI